MIDLMNCRLFTPFPDQVRIVGVAEPRAAYRERIALEHGIPEGNVFSDWEDMARRPLTSGTKADEWDRKREQENP